MEQYKEEQHFYRKDTRRKRERGRNPTKEIITENFLKLEKKNVHIQETQSPKTIYY